MKKFIFSALLFSLCTSCFAQSGVKYIDAKIDSSKLDQANADLSQIDVNFCNKPGEKNIQYVMQVWWKQDICLQATNRSSQAIQATIEFVDGSITNDQRHNKACMNAGQNKNFWQYVTGFTASFTIPANDSIFQHATLQFPISKQWIINWCLVYYTKGVEMGGQMNFTVLMRKAKFIDVQIKEKVGSLKFKAWLIIAGILIIIIFLSRKKNKKKLPKR